MNRRGVLLAAGAAALGALALPGRAVAAARVPLLVSNRPEADREFVRWLSVHDPRAGARSAAETALAGGAAAVAAFLASGYAVAVDRAAQDRVRDLAFADRAVTDYPAGSHPWVNATARRAVNGTDAELAAFAASGFAAALASDRAGVPYDDGTADGIDEGRNVVARIASLDVGDQLRRRARYDDPDAEVAEFLRHGWLSAAGIDRDTFRAQYVAHEWVQWQYARQLTTAAVAAETANPGTAMFAWDEVYARFARQPAGWTERRQFAEYRFAGWMRLVPSLYDAQSPLIASLLGEAPNVRDQWNTEFLDAGRQSAWWGELVQYALAARDRWAEAAG